MATSIGESQESDSVFTFQCDTEQGIAETTVTMYFDPIFNRWELEKPTDVSVEMCNGRIVSLNYFLTLKKGSTVVLVEKLRQSTDECSPNSDVAAVSLKTE